MWLVSAAPGAHRGDPRVTAIWRVGNGADSFRISSGVEGGNARIYATGFGPAELMENQLPEEGGPRLAVCASHPLATNGVLAMKSREANVSGMEGRISTTRGGSTRPLASN